MSRYHVVYTDRLGGKLAENETDIEPPVVGDILRLDHLTNSEDENVYVVFDRSYMALDENHVAVTCALDQYKNGPLD